MTLNSKLVALSILLSGSCTPKEREYNNPADPNSVIEKTSGKVPSPTDKAGPNGSTAPCLTLLGCTPTPGTSFNFANVFETTPTGCINVLRSESLDIGGMLRHFVLANCGARHSIYTFTTSYTGTDKTAPVNITSDCNTGTKGIVDFVVDHGTTASLVAYTCYIDSTTYNSSVVLVQDDGTLGARLFVENVYADYAGIYYKSKIRFNPRSLTFGLARLEKFRRFTETGSQLGGAITIYQGSTGAGFEIDSLEVNGSSWYFLAPYWEHQWSHCSKISESGAVTCNGVKIYSNHLIGGRADRVIGKEYSKGLKSQTLSDSTCSADKVVVGNLSNKINDNDDGPIVFNSVAINETYAVVLYQSNKNIIATVFNPTDTLVIESEAAVSEFATSQNNAFIRVINNKLNVSFDKDGRGYVAYSNESI